MKKVISATRIYRIWDGIIARCYNINRKEYPNYGGRGITVCDEWKNSSDSFIKWANNNGYSKLLEIDRENNDGDYTPENCRFVTHSINNRNTRMKSTNKTGFRGVCFHLQNNCFNAEVQADNKRFRKSGFKTAIDAARHRDKMILDNKLEGFKLNFEL